MLLCILTDLPREIELSSAVPGTREPENDGETVFIVMHASSSNATHLVDIDDKTRPTEPRSREGDTLGTALGESARHVPCKLLRMHTSLWEEVRSKSLCVSAVSFVSSHLSLGRKICVAGEHEIAGVALALLQLFFDDGA